MDHLVKKDQARGAQLEILFVNRMDLNMLNSLEQKMVIWTLLKESLSKYQNNEYCLGSSQLRYTVNINIELRNNHLWLPPSPPFTYSLDVCNISDSTTCFCILLSSSQLVNILSLPIQFNALNAEHSLNQKSQDRSKL